jgi:hypothetical protein
LPELAPDVPPEPEAPDEDAPDVFEVAEAPELAAGAGALVGDAAAPSEEVLSLDLASGVLPLPESRKSVTYQPPPLS